MGVIRIKRVIKELYDKYKHGIILSYVIFYFIWFFWLESRTDVPYFTVYMPIDDKIPFIELFIIPYFIWFAYIAVTVLYFFFRSKEDFYHCTAFLFIGMTICLIIYTIWPNQQNLRPTEFPRDNFLIDLIRNLYITDTSTNVCPSIHVFNSIAAHIAIIKSESLGNKKWVIRISFVLMVLISLSTVFLKQHSVFDGICAIALVVVMYPFIYKADYHLKIKSFRQLHKSTRINLRKKLIGDRK